MDTWQGLRWINRHGIPWFVLVGMVLICVAAHYIAVGMIVVLNEIPIADLPPGFARSILGIRFIDANWCFPFLYLFVFLGSLLHMEIRAAPRWAVSITFAVLSVPAVVYVALCLRLCTSFVIMTSN